MEPVASISPSDASVRLHPLTGTFVEPEAEEGFAAHRLQSDGRSLGMALAAITALWLLYIPLDWTYIDTWSGRATTALARLASAGGLATLAVGMARRSAWLLRPVGTWFMTGTTVTVTSSLLVVTAIRPLPFATLLLWCILAGVTIGLFAPVPLAHRAVVVAGLFVGFSSVVAWKVDPEIAHAGRLAANLVLAGAAALMGGAHLDRSARRAYANLCHANDLNARLAAEVAEGERLRTVLARRASEDALTGLMNRRAFFEAAEIVVRRIDDGDQPATALVLDADHFKAINDRHGHAVGDEVLRRMARSLLDSVRDADLVGRLGGEEFGVLLPGVGVHEAIAVADRIRASVAADPYRTDAEPVRATLSIGIAERRHGETLDEALHRADLAMYAAKRAGGDRLGVPDPRGGVAAPH